MQSQNRFRHLQREPDSPAPTGRSSGGVQYIVERTIRHVLNDYKFVVVGVCTEADEVDKTASVSNSGENLDLVLRWACTIGTTCTVGVVVARVCGRWFRELGFFDGGDKFAAIECGLIDTAVAAFA